VIDWAGMEAAMLSATAGAMDRGLTRITGRAKELAPVRKVFRGANRHYATRLKSIDEIENDRDIRRRLGLGPETAHINPPSIVTKRAPQSLSQRTVDRVDRFTGRRTEPRLQLRAAQARLDRRGRYELRSLRALHGDQLGGRLRDEIYSTGAAVEGRIVRGSVVSPTEYSIYQEFGTAHNPAHPYMRPADYEGRQPLKADIAKSVAAAVSPFFRGTISVTIKTRVR
jgi:HK97 gp10 family phage protein